MSDPVASTSSLPHSAADLNGSLDWAALRARSLSPRGFGAERARIWTSVLHAQHNAGRGSGPLEPHVSSSDAPAQEHKDERQIKLDTDRSFVLYPVVSESKDQFKHELNSIIVKFFRKRPKLHYFQGYHDIISVLFLTLSQESLLPAIEKLSLHRLRDSMGPGLEPMIGQLRILKRLLRLSDPEFASIVESTTPLPYYALSNLLTLFSHDVPTLPLIQHVFDYLLCRPPVASIYLAVAVILSHGSSIRKLVQEGEEGMLHAVLTTFPSVTDNSELEPLYGSTDPFYASVLHAQDESESSSVQSPARPEHTLSDSLDHSSNPSEDPSFDRLGSESESESVPLLSDSWTAASPLHSPDKIHAPSSAEFSAVPSSPVTNCPANDLGSDCDDDQSTLADDPLPKTPSQPLTQLLRTADDLFTRFPPSDPRLAIERILGPQSVVFTWSEHRKDMPSDDDAEKMVDAPELIVRADFVDEDDLPTKSEERRKEHETSQSWWLSGIGNKANAPSPATIIAGVVLAVSIGVAVYDISRRAQGKES